jgi:hypothetical protein
MQHLSSNCRAEDVVNEAATEDLLHRSAKIIDVGALASHTSILSEILFWFGFVSANWEVRS